MGQKKNRLNQKQREQPWCVYCGGASLGVELDHMPPMTMFDLRQRYGDMTYLACSACHTATRPLDQVAGFLCRAHQDYPMSDKEQTETRKIIRGVINNHPGLLEELRPSDKQRQYAREAGAVFGDGSGAAWNISDRVHAIMMRFAARAVLALHFELCKEVIPTAGGTLVRWYTNEALLVGTFPHDFANLLGPPQSLRQGSKSVADQFEYSSRATEDSRLSAHMATFRQSFAIQGYAAVDVATFNVALEQRPDLIFRPGFLRASLRT